MSFLCSDNKSLYTSAKCRFEKGLLTIGWGSNAGRRLRTLTLGVNALMMRLPSSWCSTKTTCSKHPLVRGSMNTSQKIDRIEK